MTHKFFKRSGIDLYNPINRSFLVAGTILAAMIVTLGIIAVRTNVFIAIFLLLVFPISIIEFPTGVVSVFTGQYAYISDEIAKTSIVFLVYICISFFIVILKNRSGFIIMYLLLLLLLAINVVGCSISAPVRLSGIN